MAAGPRAYRQFTLQPIGKGSYGAVFSATPIGYSTPTMVIKRFTRKYTQDEVAYLRDVYSEFYASSYLLVEGERELCADLASCALWFDIGTTFAHIGFPYTDAISLRMFVERELDTRGEARKSATVQLTLLFIIDKMMRGLALIHETGVIHSDVKLENLIVERSADSSRVGRVSGVRIIDFGIACSESPAVRQFFADITVPVENEQFLRCFRDEADQIYYHTTELYQDPRSLENGEFKLFSRERDAQLAFLKFDLFAAACVIVYLFDPLQYAYWVAEFARQNAVAKTIRAVPIKIRATSYMPAWKVTDALSDSSNLSRRSSSSSSEGGSNDQTMTEESEEESCDSCGPLIDVLEEMAGPLAYRKEAYVYANTFNNLYALFYKQIATPLKK
jgi:serine/threonine protein kinase